MNRCTLTGVEHTKPYLSTERSAQVRSEVDKFLDKQIELWNATVPFAKHFEDKSIHQEYYTRHLIETIWRIRLLRVSEGRTLAEIAKRSPEAAQFWAKYETEEMVHDDLFLLDLQAKGGSKEDVLKTEPYLSTKLLTGFFLYLLEHEGPLGVVAYSYLVEYANVKIEPKKLKAMKESLGDTAIKGQVAHSHTDTYDDHPGEVWSVIHHLIRGEDDITALYKYLEEQQRILGMYFKEIYEDKVAGRSQTAAQAVAQTATATKASAVA